MRHVADTQTRDGLRLASRTWLPETTPRGSVVLLHDVGEHVGRYERLAAALMRADLRVYGYDQRGHGASGGRRARVRSVGHLVEDLALVVECAAARGGDAALGRAPWALVGQGLGALVALRAVQTTALAPVPDALILAAPFLRPRHGPPPALTRPLALLARVAPWFPFTPLDPATMSRDPVEAAAYRDDPMVAHGPLDVGTAATMATAGAAALAPNAAPLTLPTLVLHGSDDAISDPAASAALAASNPGITHHVEPGGQHALFHDTCRAFVTDLVIRWLLVRLERERRVSSGRGVSPAG